MPELFRGLRDFEAKLRGGEELPASKSKKEYNNRLVVTESGDAVPSNITVASVSGLEDYLLWYEGGTTSYTEAIDGLTEAFGWHYISDDFAQACRRLMDNPRALGIYRDALRVYRVCLEVRRIVDA